MEENEYRDNEKVPYKVRAKLSLPHKEPEEADCIITEGHLVIEAEQLIRVPIHRIKEVHREWTPSATVGSLSTVKLMYIDHLNEKQRLSLEMNGDDAFLFDSKLTSAIGKATEKFSNGEAVGFGWNTMKRNLWFFIGILIVVGLIYYVPDIIAALVEEDAPVLSIIISIASWVLYMVVQMGLIRIALRFCDNEKGEFANLFSCFPLFLKYLFGSILYGLIVFGGTLLLIVPGIIWSIKFFFYDYFIVDKGLGPIESLKRSSAITRGAKWDVAIFCALLGLINLVGALCLLIGLFATIPTTMVAMAFVYRKLLTQAELARTPDTALQA